MYFQDLPPFHLRSITIVDPCLVSFTLSKIGCLFTWYKSQNCTTEFFFFCERVVWGQTRVKQRTRHSQESKLVLATKPWVAFFKIVCLSSESLALFGFELGSLLDLHFHSKWDCIILISTQPDLKMTSLYTGGGRGGFQQTSNWGPAVIVDLEIAASAFPGLRGGQSGSAGLGRDH